MSTSFVHLRKEPVSGSPIWCEAKSPPIRATSAIAEVTCPACSLRVSSATSHDLPRFAFAVPSGRLKVRLPSGPRPKHPTGRSGMAADVLADSGSYQWGEVSGSQWRFVVGPARSVAEGPPPPVVKATPMRKPDNAYRGESFTAVDESKLGSKGNPDLYARLRAATIARGPDPSAAAQPIFDSYVRDIIRDIAVKYGIPAETLRKDMEADGSCPPPRP